MTDQVLYCEGPECEREVAGHGRGLCSGHLKQWQRTGKLVPLVEKISPKEHLLNLCDRWLQADTDEDHDAAERGIMSAAKAMGKASLTPEDVADFVRQALSEAARRRIAAARDRGARFGRPTVDVDPAEVFRLLAGLQSPTRVAFVLKISRATVYRILKRSTFATHAIGPRGQRGSP